MEDRHAARSTLPVPRPGGTFAWLMFGEVVIGFGLFLLMILSLLVTEGLGMDAATLGLAFAAISAGGFTCAFVGGVVADRLGPRFVALTALAFTFVGGLAVALAPDAVVLAAGEFLIGAAIAIYGVTAYAWINETLGERRGAYLGLYVVSLVIGLIAASLAVAFLLDSVPSWRTFYLASAVLALVPILPLWFLLPPRIYAPQPRHAVRTALRNRDVLQVSAQQLLCGVFASGYSWVPLFLIEYRGYDVPGAALALVASAGVWAVGSILFGGWADRGWSPPIVALGCFGGGSAYLAFLVWSSPAGSFAALLVFSFLWPAAANVPLTFLGQRLGPTAQRTEIGVMENLFLVGDGAGAAAIGFVATGWTLAWGMMTLPTAAILLGGAVFGAAYGLGRRDAPVLPGALPGGHR